MTVETLKMQAQNGRRRVEAQITNDPLPATKGVQPGSWLKGMTKNKEYVSHM